MSREKQIEEMAVDLCLIDGCKRLPQVECNNTTCAHCVAEALYNAGYRKQIEGEWVKDAPHWRYKCNQCGFFPLMLHGDFLPFCPTCGAKMKGGAE